MPRIHQLLLGSLVLALSHPQREYTLRGRLVDNPSKHPVTAGVVRAPSFGIVLHTDTLGTFQVRIHATPGCYLFLFQGLGYGATAVSVPFDSGAVVSLGDIPLNPAPILEYKTLYYERCRLPDSVSVHNDMLGIDTVRVPHDSLWGQRLLPNMRLKLSARGRRFCRNGPWKPSLLTAAPAARSLSAIR